MTKLFILAFLLITSFVFSQNFSFSKIFYKEQVKKLKGTIKLPDTSFFQWGKPYFLDNDQGVLECHSDNKENYPPFIINKDSIYKISIVIGVLRME